VDEGTSVLWNFTAYPTQHNIQKRLLYWTIQLWEPQISRSMHVTSCIYTTPGVSNWEYTGQMDYFEI